MPPRGGPDTVSEKLAIVSTARNAYVPVRNRLTWLISVHSGSGGGHERGESGERRPFLPYMSADGAAGHVHRPGDPDAIRTRQEHRAAGAEPARTTPGRPARPGRARAASGTAGPAAAGPRVPRRPARHERPVRQRRLPGRAWQRLRADGLPAEGDRRAAVGPGAPAAGSGPGRRRRDCLIRPVPGRLAVRPARGLRQVAPLRSW